MPILAASSSARPADAVQRYFEERERTILPRFISPRTFALLWTLLLLHGAVALGAGFARFPVYASGTAVVLPARAGSFIEVDEAVVAVLLPPNSLGKVRAGQKLVLERGGPRDRAILHVVAVEPRVLSPAALEERLALPRSAAPAAQRPAVVAWAPWPPAGDGLRPAAHRGSLYRADVEIGSRRAGSWLPIVGVLFAESGE